MALTPTTQPQPVYNGNVPCNGAYDLAIPLDFGAATTYEIDVTTLQQQGFIEGIQTVYVDNSLNGSPLIITCSVTSQKIQVPSLAQGFFPLLQPTPAKITVNTAGGAPANQIIHILNFYLPPAVWKVA